MTLPAGTFEIRAQSPALAVDNHRLFWHDGSADIILGQNSVALAASGGQTMAFLYGRFTISSPTTYTLQHWCNTAQATNGLGNRNADSANGVETYSDVQIKKLP